MPIETFNISFESTLNKQQYGTKIICTKIRGGGGGGGSYDDRPFHMLGLKYILEIEAVFLN